MASMVLSIALMGLISAILYIHRLDQAARENSLALSGAVEKMEEILAAEHDEIFETYDGQAFSVVGLSEQPDDPDGEVGLVSIDNTDPDLLIVEVEVDWFGVTGRNSVELNSLLARRN